MSVIDGVRLGVPRQNRRQLEQRLFIGGLVLNDALVALLCYALAYGMRFTTGLPIFEDGTIKPDFYVALIIAIIPIQLGIYFAYGLYNRINLLGGTVEYSHFFNATSTVALLIVFLSFLFPEFIVARGWLMLAWGLTIALGLVTRFLLRRLVYGLRASGMYRDRTLIVGANPEGIAVATQLMQARSVGAQIIGFIDDYMPAGSEPIAKAPVLGGSHNFANLVEQHAIDTVVIANTAITRERLLGIYSALDALQNVEVRLASGLFEMLTTGVRVREEGFVPLVVLNKTRITGLHLILKTLLDYITAGLALIALLPVLLVIWVLVWRDSPGPVIYRRRVVGQGKREFDAFKFRTMRIEGDRLLSPEQRRELDEQGKLKDDPRITRVGNFLRKYSLDELPQLFNVLRGEMSLIGPRMITLKELEKFGKWQYNLATVKPGLTGLWQISGRSDLSYEERVRLDMQYIRNHTIWLDLHILFQTVPALVTGRGAY